MHNSNDQVLRTFLNLLSTINSYSFHCRSSQTVPIFKEPFYNISYEQYFRLYHAILLY